MDLIYTNSKRIDQGVLQAYALDLSFGDSENDLTMVKNSGIGVAMENAVSELKQAAKYITKSNNENGVMEFLKLYL